MARFDRWTVLRIIEVILVLACLVVKRVTDDEARSLFLYLQKLSREWRLLTNITWDRVGSSVADATYGGYLVITSALLIGKLAGDLPTTRRITEMILLGIGAILFIVMGSLAFASIDSVPHDLIDNGAILGALSVITGALFLLDMGAPKKQKPRTTSIEEQSVKPTNQIKESKSITEQIFDLEREIDRNRRSNLEKEQWKDKPEKETVINGIRNGEPKIKNKSNGGSSGANQFGKDSASKIPTKNYMHLDPSSKGYKQMKDDDLEVPRRFGIYGKDVMEFEESETDETASIPPRIELRPPLWGHIGKGRLYTHYGDLGFR